METAIRYRGRIFTEAEIEEIRAIISANREKSRWKISREICSQWGWRQANGALKDMVCRGLMLHLQSLGLIEQPPVRRATPYRLAHSKKPDLVETDRTEVKCALSELKPIEVHQVRGTSTGKIYNGLVQQHHYLEYTRPVGEHLEYVALSEGRAIACMGWSSAARHIRCRDRHIGWDKHQRQRNLHHLIVNTRFLILPWIRVPHLASHLIGLIARRISRDWREVYNHDIVWLETFVDAERGFKGTCYRAANWQYLGKTTGRGKADMTHKQNRSIKDVYGYPLIKDFRRVLCDGIL